MDVQTLTQASKAILAKTRILETLTQPTIQGSPEPMRYMELYAKVKEDIGSLNTFEKYLVELEKQDHSIRREPDPKDTRAKIIVPIPEALRAQLIFLDSLSQIKEVTESSTAADHDWRKHADGILKGKVRLTQKEEDELFSGPAYKWMVATNQLLSIAISAYTKAHEQSLRRMNQGFKHPLDVYFRITKSTLDIVPREQVAAYLDGAG